MRVYEFDFNESEENGTHRLWLGEKDWHHGKDVPGMSERVALDGRYDTAPIVEGVVEHLTSGRDVTYAYVRLDWATARYDADE